MKADGESSDRLGHQLRHQRHVRRRIDAAGKKNAERHVGHHAFLNRSPQQLQNIFLMLFFSPYDRGQPEAARPNIVSCTLHRRD